MDATTSRLLSCLALPPGLVPSPSGGGAMMHTNPFSFGLDIALPSPASFRSFSDGGRVHAMRSNPFSFFDQFSGGGAVHTLQANPFSGGAAGHALHTNPFSFGLDIANPPLAGYDPFSDGATVHADEHSNPFAVDLCDDLPPPAVFGPFSAGADTDKGPKNLDDYVSAGGALSGLPDADSPRTPVYSNPFNANAAAALSMKIPALWEWDLDGGHSQPAVDEPVPPLLIPAPTASVRENATTAPAKTPCRHARRPQLCASYDDDDDIETILRAQEEDVKSRPSTDYMATTQGGRMSPEMRTALVSWMTGITRRYDLAPVTLHRAVSYADRFLSARPLSDASAHGLNLLGAAAVYAAAKYEDQAAVYKLKAREIARHGGFATGREVVDMERALLAALDYRLSGPTAHTFVEHFTRDYGQEKGDDLGPELRFRAHDFADVSLLHYGCLELKPSAVAAAAMLLAMRTLKPSYRRMVAWGRELEELTGYKPKDLERGVDAIRALIPKDETARAARDISQSRLGPGGNQHRPDLLAASCICMRRRVAYSSLSTNRRISSSSFSGIPTKAHLQFSHSPAGMLTAGAATGGGRPPERMPLLIGARDSAWTPENTGLQTRASADTAALRVERQRGVRPRSARSRASTAGAGASTAAGCLHRRSPPSARWYHTPGRALLKALPSLRQISSRISRTNSSHGNRLEALEPRPRSSDLQKQNYTKKTKNRDDHSRCVLAPVMKMSKHHLDGWIREPSRRCAERGRASIAPHGNRKLSDEPTSFSRLAFRGR
ncbi:hypothetical protein GQ55_1G292800 [Panicum hallii var. hallii]|uniref:Cyclin N-terminal domain-containing protein n=1 Tax=Panicum hallii var. hallii TaxID=1504633 RepID=A0A2T7F8Q5_9POAL|nr:hypothetical protein GQ55_1G292800 [Panicum hallii var. hallii]